jgi:amino acid transporter
MNLWSVASLGVGAMVGAGIFALLGQAALLAGRETYVAFIFAGVVAALSGYSYAKLAVCYPDGGGISTYFDHAFGTARLSGTLSLIYLLTIAVTVALVAKAFGAYVTALAFGGSSRLVINILASSIVIVLTLVNAWGTGLVGRAEVLLVAIKLVILVGLMVAGAISVMGKASVAHMNPGIMGLVSAVGLTFLAYAGFGMMANAAGSVANPRQTIPRAIYLAIGVVIALYVGLSIVVLDSVPAAQFAQHSDTAVAEAARPILGQAGFVIVSLGAVLATASGINAWIFSAIKMALAMAKGGQLPRMFSQRFWRTGTRGFLLGVIGVLLIINIFDLNALARIASAVFLITYLAVHVAHWWLVQETKGSRLAIAAGFLSMAAVLLCLLWSTALTQPWTLVFIAAFVAGSWGIEWLLKPGVAAPTHTRAAHVPPYTSK